jgi:hypothetical protein
MSVLMPLGRNTPSDYHHVEAFPLDALAPEEQPTHQAVAPGVNWYTGFDTPVKGDDGKYRLPSKRLGTIRGGHCVCLEPAPQPGQPGSEQDTLSWWAFYNQGQEGACEGFGHARRFSLLHRKTFDAFHLYDDARRIEGTYPGGEGTTNKAICEALKRWGIHAQTGHVAHRSSRPVANPIAIGTFRWAKTADEVLAVLGYTSGTEVPLLNSWGHAYPERVYIAPETIERLLREGGECDVLTDR